ncbi:hypothetical protein ACO2Q8_16745 [Larkinella sp. VNQ87]|uniref:hypothetical protein n=1 Tax=Larkinella sp. VNQ87 TaxID=3400921 RepID=UPI003C0BA645
MAFLQKRNLDDVIAIIREAEDLWSMIVDSIPDGQVTTELWSEIREVDQALPSARLTIEAIKNQV